MAHNLTDIDTFTSAVTVPDGGDPRTAASVELPFQAVANRTRNVKNRLDALASGLNVTAGDVRASSDFEYCDATGAAVSVTRTIMVPLENTGPGLDWSKALGKLTSTATFGTCEIRLPVVTGARVTMVRVAYQNAVSGARAVVNVTRKVATKGATPGFNTNIERSDSDGTPGTTLTTPQIMSTGVFSSTVVNLATEEWYAAIACSGAEGDVILWVELTMSDPGPRNF